MNQHDDSIEAVAEEDAAPVKRRSWIWRRWVTIVSIVVIVLFSAIIFFGGGVSDDLWAYGYLGIFLISILGSAVIFIPIPSLPVVYFMGMILNPLLVGVMVGLGEPIGELPTYWAGRGGQVSNDRLENMKKRRIFGKPVAWMERRGALVIFTFALLPNPAFDLAGAAAGTLRYPFWKFLLILMLGKMVKGWVIAFAGYLTLYLLLRFLL